MNRVKISGAKAIVVVLGSEGCRRQDGFSGAEIKMKNGETSFKLTFSDSQSQEPYFRFV